VENRATNRKSGSEATQNAFANLFKYYLDCLARDDDSGVDVFADSKHELDYIEVEHWPLEGESADTEPGALIWLIGLQRAQARRKTLWLG
jgi:hypothetical protein